MELLALAIGIWIGWAYAIRKYVRLERFVTDSEVHAEIAKLVRMCAERDEAWAALGKTRDLEKQLLGDDRNVSRFHILLNHHQRELEEAWEKGEAAENVASDAYQRWLEYDEKIRELIARYGLGQDLRLRLLRGKNPPVTPAG